MYHPFIRGKQFELLMLREMAPKIAQWGFVPILEPVKGNFPALERALDALIKSNCHFILIANPSVGDLKEDNSLLWTEIFDGKLMGYNNYSAGLNLTTQDRLATASDFFRRHRVPTAVIHNGFSDGKGLSALIGKEKPTITSHVFDEQHGTLYRRHFKADRGVQRVLIEDGFICRTNRNYPDSEPFSELYLTYKEMGFDAFGDFLIVGSDFKEGGGPAYAIAIHLTYADPATDDVIKVKHYVSDQVDTPKDPAGKFLEALKKLTSDVRLRQSKILRTKAVDEYLQLYKEQHFPGLGYTKKLSMQHHLELMAHLLGSEA